MLMSSKSPNEDKKILRNALIEGAWAFTTFMVGAGASQLKLDPLSWAYAGVGSFMAGFVGYLVMAYKLGTSKKGDKT